MKILLVSPVMRDDWHGWHAPNVGIAYISAALKRAGFHVLALSLSAFDAEHLPKLKRFILENDIDVLATGGFIKSCTVQKDIMSAAKEAKKDIAGVIGGGLVSNAPLEAMTVIRAADYGVIGEGERTICELCNELAKPELERNIKKVKGIIYRQESGGELLFTPPRPEIDDIDSIPWPDYDGFLNLPTDAGKGELKNAFLVTSRSCPYSCTFCSKSGGRKYRQRSLDDVFAELEHMVSRYNIDSLTLCDDLFAVNQDRVFDFCRRIKPYNIVWNVSMRVGKHITPELLAAMKDSNCVSIQYGLESADDSILKSMNKKTTLADIRGTLEITKNSGIKLGGSGFIFGDPAETLKTARNTLDWVFGHADLLGELNLAPVIPYPGSAIYDQAVLGGKIKNTVEYLQAGCPSVNISQMTDAEYQYFFDFELRKFQVEYDQKLFHSDAVRKKLEVSKDLTSYLYTRDCAQCGHEIKIELYPENFSKKQLITCSKCRYLHLNVNLELLFILSFNDMITDLIKKKTALWGVSLTMHKLYANNRYFREADIPIFDIDKKKQSAGFYGKNVYSPLLLQEMSFDNVIFFFPVKSYLHKAVPEVSGIFDHVKKNMNAFYLFDIINHIKK